MHVLVDSGLTVDRSHEICEAIERDIRELLPGTVVVIHMEPDHSRPGVAEPAAGRPADD